MWHTFPRARTLTSSPSARCRLCWGNAGIRTAVARGACVCVCVLKGDCVHSPRHSTVHPPTARRRVGEGRACAVPATVTHASMVSLTDTFADCASSNERARALAALSRIFHTSSARMVVARSRLLRCVRRCGVAYSYSRVYAAQARHQCYSRNYCDHHARSLSGGNQPPAAADCRITIHIVSGTTWKYSRTLTALVKRG